MTKETIREQAITIAKLLSDKKGYDVQIIDVEAQTALFDYIIVATAESYIHLSALAHYAADKLDEMNVRRKNKIESLHENPWILLDCGYMIVHLLNSEAREFYRLEKIWGEGEKIFDSSLSESGVMS